MSGLPEGWSIDVEPLENGVTRFTLRGPWSEYTPMAERLAGGPVELKGTTYPTADGSAWVEHVRLPEMDDPCGYDGVSNNELVRPDALRARAAFYIAIAEDVAERERSTSADVRIVYPGDGKPYSFECNQRAAVGDIVAVAHRSTRGGGLVEVEVVALGTGGWDGPRKPAKFVRRLIEREDGTDV